MQETRTARGRSRRAPRGPSAPLLDGATGRTGWPTRCAQTASRAGVDRCYVFENLRGPDGRLWMDLIGEWTAPERAPPRCAWPGANLHPYSPRLPALDRRVRRRRRDRRPGRRRCRARAARRSARRAPRPRGWCRSRAGDDWWGFVGIDVCRATAPWTDDDGAAVARARAARSARPSSAPQVRTSRRCARGPVPLDRRSTARSSPTSTRPTRRVDAVYVSPQIEELLGYTAEEWMADPDLWPQHPAPRRPGARPRRERPAQRDGRALPARVPAHASGRAAWSGCTTRRAIVRDERGKIVATRTA